MKRTGELVMGIIGSVLLLIGILIGFSFSTVFGSDEFNNQFQEDFAQELQNDPAISDAEMEAATEIFGALGSFTVAVTISWVIAGILGIIATIFVKKKTKLSGILFIVGGVVGIASIIPAILYVIAGIMALVRKAPTTTEPYETV
ncbi:DUF4064 domain-containing protein [Alkalihalobacillus sp. FSL R5-0424]